MRVVNDQGQVLDLPEQEAWQGVMSGALGFEPGASVPLTNAAGVVGTVKAEDLHSALQQGYVPATQADFDRAAKEARYDTAGHMVGAGAAGVARGLTFGLSDAAIAGVGGEGARQTLADYQEYHPGVSLAGEITGAVIPALVSGGTTAEASGVGIAKGLARAATAPGRGVAALGRLAEEGVAGMVGTGAKSMLGRGVQAVLPKAIGAGVEGAFQGAGSALSESVIKNHDLTAEKLCAGVKEGALMGALFGGGASGLGFAAGEARSAIANRIARLPEGKVVDQVVDMYAKGSGFLTGKDPAAIKRLLRDEDFLAKAIRDPKEVTAGFARQLAGDFDKLDDKLRQAHSFLWGEGKRTQIRALVPKGNTAAIEVEAKGLLGKLRAEVDQMAADPVVYNSPLRLKQARALLDHAENVVATARGAHGDKAGAYIFSELNMVKQRFGKFSRPNMMLGAEDGVAQRMRGMYDDALKPFLEQDELFGKAAEAQRTINAGAKQHIGVSHEFDRRFSSSTGLKDPHDEWMTLAQRDPGKIQSTLERLGDPSADLAAEVMRQHPEQAINMLQAQLDGYVLTPAQKTIVRDAIDAAKRAKSALAVAEEHVGAMKVYQDLKGAQAPLASSLAGAMPVTGAVVGGGVGAAIGTVGKLVLDAATDPAGIARKLAFVRNAVRDVDVKIDSAMVRMLAKKAEHGARRAAVAVATRPEYADSRKARRADYERKLTAVRAALADPKRATAHLANLDNAAPSIAAAARASAQRQLAVLSSALPKRPDRVGVQPKPAPVSDGEVSRFLRTFDAATNPTKTIDRLADGTVTRAEMVALREANPSLYADLQQRAIARVSEETAAGRELPYEARVKLARLLDVPTDPSVAPAFVAATQALFAQAEQENAARAQTAQAAKVKINLERYRYGESGRDEGKA